MVEGWWRVGSDSHIMITGHCSALVGGEGGDLTRAHICHHLGGGCCSCWLCPHHIYPNWAEATLNSSLAINIIINRLTVQSAECTLGSCSALNLAKIKLFVK